jgi:hypothetical protein
MSKVTLYTDSIIGLLGVIEMKGLKSMKATKTLQRLENPGGGGGLVCLGGGWTSFVRHDCL